MAQPLQNPVAASRQSAADLLFAAKKYSALLALILIFSLRASAVDPAEIYARATNSFLDALYLKPTPASNTDLTFQLAPLIIQEVAGGKKPWGGDQFGSLSFSGDRLALDLSRPVIYAGVDQVRINHRTHLRVSYLWCHSLRPATGTETALPLQGIRITLDAASQPAIWEVLADPSGARLVFVSQSLDTSARSQFGPPLPHRRFASERSVAEAPNVVVARVLDDGPMPLGPMVYLRAGSRAVTTLACRCMSTQAKNLVATITYELRPCQSTSADPLLTQAKTQTKSQTAFWPGEGAEDNQLERFLRLPANF